MLEERPEIEIDFEGEIKSLANQADAKNAPAAGGARIDRGELTQVIGNLIRPLAQELEALRRGPMHEHSVMLAALGKAINSQNSSSPLDTVARELRRLESIETEIRRLGSVETANQKLFDALHAELKTYKDNFLFDSLQRPYIRDLVSLFDDLSEVHVHMLKRLEESAGKKDSGDTAFLRTLAGNVENQIAHMIEVFLRMDVVLSRTCAGAPLDKKTHRTIAIEPANGPDDDATVARSIKPGFSWRERTVRPEDVVVRRWTAPGTPPPAPPPDSLILTPNAS